jgi:3-isopropylmalate dehydratase small subunit
VHHPYVLVAGRVIFLLVKNVSVDQIVNRQNLRKSKRKRYWPNLRYGRD